MLYRSPHDEKTVTGTDRVKRCSLLSTMALSVYIFTFAKNMLSTTTLLICVAIFLVAYTIICQLYSRLPPGPIGLPVVSLIRSVISKDKPHDFISKLAKRYGNVFCIGFGGGRRFVFMNNFASVAEAYNNPTLSERRVGGAREKFTAGNPFEEEWKHNRSYILAVLRSFGDKIEDQIKHEVTFLSNQFDAFEGKLFDPKFYLTNAVSNIICYVVFGKRFSYDDKQFKRLLSLSDERMQLIGSGSVNNFFPSVSYIFGSGRRKEYIVKEIIDFFKMIILEHESSLDTLETCNNLIDMYLKENGVLQRPSAVVNEAKLASLIDTLFLAGTETSSNTLVWSLLYMAGYPDIQKRIQDEIHLACGERLPSYSNQQNMPYTHAVILELQRLNTVLPFGVPHYAGENTTLQGYDIPKGTFILANVWGILHDPEIWPEPKVFKPERFLDENGEISIPKEWIPFSIGRRACIGKKMANMEIFIFLTHLLRRFSFRKPDNCSEMCFEGTSSSATNGPLPFEIAAVSRTPSTTDPDN